MADVFISYKSVRAAAEHLAESLIDSETLNVLVPGAPPGQMAIVARQGRAIATQEGGDMRQEFVPCL